MTSWKKLLILNNQKNYFQYNNNYMEKYSFLKYIKSQEKIYLKQAKYLNFIIQKGGDNIDVKKIQLELLKIKKKIEEIRSRKVDTIIDPYDKLKEQFDKINDRIKDIDKNVSEITEETANASKMDILNKIRDINIVLDSDPKDYTKIIASSKLNFISEKIDPKQVNLIMDKYISDSEKMVEDIRKQIGGIKENGEELYNNVNLGEIKETVQAKVVEYTNAMEPFKNLSSDLDNYINQIMESIKVKIDENTLPQLIGNNDIVVNVPRGGEEKLPQINLDESFFQITSDEQPDINNLINPNFVKNELKGGALSDPKKLEITTNQVNNFINELHNDWYDKLQKYKSHLETELPKIIEIQKFINDNNKNIRKLDLIIDIIEKNKSVKTISTFALNDIKQFLKKQNVDYEKTKEKIRLEGGEYKKYPSKFEGVITKLLTEINGYISEIKTTDEAEKLKFLTDIKNIIENDDTSVKYHSIKSYQVGGAEKSNINDVIIELSKYESTIREMKKIRRDLDKKIKLYNIRYSQFFNFQKYIVNYVSLKIAAGGYSYYQFMSKGSIIYFRNLLEKLDNILNKFDDYSKYYNDIDVKKDINKFFYGKHYFMIKNLKIFFDQLYTFWNNKYKEHPEKWKSRLFIKTDEPSTPNNLKNFFLFNIFYEILEQYNLTLPATANFVRIVDIAGREKGVNSFQKGNEKTLSIDALKKCKNVDENIVKSISNIHFDEIFDPNDFKHNDNLALYMNLNGFLKNNKSIMLLTYGYSGVGKSYTLFGAKTKPKQGEDSANFVPVYYPGMLQSTLSNLGSDTDISLKVFELYGLGVPYKFYWRDSNNFTHFIYDYELMKDKPEIRNVSEISKSDIANYIKDVNRYNKLSNLQVRDFSTIVSSINDIRKRDGRIKSTLNNPESSRSIMIYDFKIKTLNVDKEYVNLVIVDLPGKEDLFQTYCESKDPNFDISPKFKNFKTSAGDTTEGSYDDLMLRAMTYINPLWLSMIPEIATHFDFKENKNRHLNIVDPKNDIAVIGNFSTALTDEDKVNQPAEKSKYLNENKSNKKIKLNSEGFIGESIQQINISNANVQFQTFEQINENPKYDDVNSINLYAKDKSIRDNLDKTKIINMVKNTFGLSGLSERALFIIVDMIRNGNLIELGNKINKLLDEKNIVVGKDETGNDITKTNIDLKYGYVGMEGVYINENILGLLQILTNKIKNLKEGPNPSKVNVVCQQDEIYTKFVNTVEEYRIVVDPQLMNDPILKASRFLDQDEFLSQIYFLDKFKTTNIDISPKTPYNRSGESFDVFLRGVKNEGYKPEPKTYNDKKIIDWITNYDYNKIYNIEDPPIKQILEPYLENIDNIYLFSVVSNNLKKIDGRKSIDTCDKQIKLIYDTQKFMEIISASDTKDIKGIICKN